MNPKLSLDALVRARLKTWPQQPPGMATSGSGKDTWLRGRPSDCPTRFPFLKFPGSNQLRTLPDGLWLNFGGSVVEPFVDILAVEACGSLSNLLDKRSRFAPSTHSLLAVCPVPWLLAPTLENDPTPRWQTIGLIREAPALAFIVPVRDVRVLYALKKHHYVGFAASQVPHPHEYFVPMESLTDVEGDKDPALQALLARASVNSNFLSPPLLTSHSAGKTEKRKLTRVRNAPQAQTAAITTSAITTFASRMPAGPQSTGQAPAGQYPAGP